MSNNLSKIAAARGWAAEAASWRRKAQESFAAYAGSSQTVLQWKEEIAVIAAACQGNAEAQAAAQQIIAHYQEKKDWAALAAAFQRILDGERDVEQLRGSLDRTDFVIVRALLAQLAGDDSELEQETNEPDGDEEGLSFDEFFALVAQAMQPGAPPELKAQMLGVTEQLAANADLPDELRKLGAVLGQLLSGVTPDFAAIPPQLAEMLRELQG